MGLIRRLTGLVARHVPVKSARLHARRPIASITFDDFPKSAWITGGAMLAGYGVRGTYYAAGSLAGQVHDGIAHYDADDLRAVIAAGHEIGCHGFAHERSINMPNAVLADDTRRNREFLRPFLGGTPPESYAFPYGAVSLRTKRLQAPHFSNLRGVHPGVNLDPLDLAQLKTTGVETSTWNEGAIAHAIAQARSAKGWIVFHTHDVSDSPSPYGCTPAMLERVLKGLKDGGIEVLPMREALRVATGDVP
jgi:peptidoglycan/xylan/chitin deacetylase (PgdA/CDA1 family)